MKLPPHTVLTVESNGGLMREIHTPLTIHIPNNSVQYAQVTGLWDTGATGSAITKRVVQQLGLLPTGVTQVQTAGGVFWQNQYTIDLALPNNVLIQGIVATELDGVVGADSDVLIGMDVITLGDFAITNHNNKTVMSFRLPSCEVIDFTMGDEYMQPIVNGAIVPSVKNNGNSIQPKVERNSPCPCGSGKKYKKCHGAGS